MFTGIVEEMGWVAKIDLTPGGQDARMRIDGPTVTGDVGHGDSIAVNGVCLTVVEASGTSFEVDVMGETLQRTTIGGWQPGAAVNLERSVTPAGRLGGHVVQGHIDGTARLAARDQHPAYDVLTFTVEATIAKYIAGKGAIAIDGVSLTVVAVQDTADGARFTIGIIPETQRATTLGAVEIGAAVNIEVDVMAKYVERLLTAGSAGPAQDVQPTVGRNSPGRHHRSAG